MDYLSRALELKKELDSIYDLGAPILLDHLKDIKTKVYVYIQAYTPGFNDGEPCEHSSYLYYGEELKDFIEEECYEDDVIEFLKPFTEDINKIKHKDLDQLPNNFGEAIELIDNVLHRYYGTDYQVLFIIGEGHVRMIKEDYSCGY